jgi:carbamoyl-phosphate synthase large subunit
MFPEVDPLLGPEMRSTGEVLGLADSFGMAFFKAQEATQSPLPVEGSVLITVADSDKSSVLEPARLFADLGFQIYATRGTREFLEKHGLAAETLRKLGHGRPDIVDAIKNRQVQLIINTPVGKASQEDDSYIRKTAIRFKVSYITTTAAATAAAKGIAARRAGEPEAKSLQRYHREIR